ncbi:ABC transporter permease [Paenibacillus silvisoli]|uniref:ABC transporter permease n=1 Tax=Paenibacillus silvisoli TaxID=3110539 RepID=UPI0028052AF5|nr:ABC transporter permease subunit [Paenibacillus silvisoli]
MELTAQPEANVKQVPGVKRRELLRTIRSQKWLLLFVTPAVVLTFVFSYLPMFGNIIAFQDYDIVKGFFGSPFVGFKHFKELFQDPHSLLVIKNTVILSTCNIIFTFPAPILLALLLNELRSMVFKRSVQTISYLPHFISWVIILGFYKEMTSIDGGLFNEIKMYLYGGEPVMFQAKAGWFLPVVVISNIWKEIGWNTIIFLAALSGIDQQLYEAAAIDGAGKLKRILHITLPGILPTIMILLILSLSHIFGTNFDQVYNLINVHIQDKVDVLETYVFTEGIEKARFPFATAVGLFQGVISFILVVVSNKLSKKFTEISIW